MRGPGSILTGGNILSLHCFWFYIVKPLMPLLALLPLEFFTVYTKLAEMALLYSKELTTAKISYLHSRA